MSSRFNYSKLSHKDISAWRSLVCKKCISSLLADISLSVIHLLEKWHLYTCIFSVSFICCIKKIEFGPLHSFGSRLLAIWSNNHTIYGVSGFYPNCTIVFMSDSRSFSRIYMWYGFENLAVKCNQNISFELYVSSFNFAFLDMCIKNFMV